MKLRIVVAIAILAFIAKCSLALFTYGTNDITTWDLNLEKLFTQGPDALYRRGVQFLYKGRPAPVQIFSHPPAMIHVLYFWGFLVKWTGLPLRFWIRFCCAVADAIALFVVWRMSRTPALSLRPASLMLLAACPISLLISGFHGNTDPIMTLFVLLSVYFLYDRPPGLSSRAELGPGRRPALAGLFFGLALCIKFVPLIFAPAFFLYLRTWKARLQFVAVAALTAILAGLPYIASDPVLMLRRLGAYSGMPGVWSGIFASLGIPAAVHKSAFFALLLALSVGMNAPRVRLPLFAQVGAIVTFFLFFAPGFGIQYYSWSVPWVLYLGVSETLAYYAICGSFILAVYLHWAVGNTWGDAANDIGPGPVASILLLVVMWMLAVLLLQFGQRWRRATPRAPG